MILVTFPVSFLRRGRVSVLGIPIDCVERRINILERGARRNFAHQHSSQPLCTEIAYRYFAMLDLFQVSYLDLLCILIRAMWHHPRRLDPHFNTEWMELERTCFYLLSCMGRIRGRTGGRRRLTTLLFPSVGYGRKRFSVTLTYLRLALI